MIKLRDHWVSILIGGETTEFNLFGNGLNEKDDYKKRGEYGQDI